MKGCVMHTRAGTHTHAHTHIHTHTQTHKHKHTHMKTPVPRSLAPYPEKASTVTYYVRFNPHIVPPSLLPACLPPSLPTYVRSNPQCIHMLSRALAAAPPAPPCDICTVAPCLVADSGRQCGAAGRRGRSPCPHRHCAVRFSQPIHCLN